MSWKNLVCLCLTLVGCLALCGCGPSATGSADEEKEPQFLIGRSRVNAMDYQGAIEAFELALETNPRSGAAHLELGCLYEDKEPDPARAIYHYEKYLKLRPGAANAETIGQRILRLKQELAKGMLPIPPSPLMQRQLEQLTEENRQLRDQIDRLRASSTPVSLTNRMIVQSVTPPISSSNNASSTGARPVTVAAGASRAVRSSTATTRTHRVQAGETPTAIARRYNVKVDVLLAANPGLNSKRMQVGQSLVIPGR